MPVQAFIAFKREKGSPLLLYRKRGKECLSCLGHSPGGFRLHFHSRMGGDWGSNMHSNPPFPLSSAISFHDFDLFTGPIPFF
jgi:hypothetical protein